MRKALFLILFLAAWVAMSSAVSAGIVSSLLSANNTNNDPIQDRSTGYILDLNNDGAGPGDIGWGVIRVDSIRNQSLNVKNRVFLVYAAQVVSSPSPAVHTWVPGASVWSLKSLVAPLGDISGSYGTDFGPIAALIEAPTDRLFTGVDFDNNLNSNTPTVLKGLIGTSLAGASILATVGLKDPQDYYWLTGSGVSFQQQAEMSIIQSFMGPVNDWKGLFDPFPIDGQNWLDNEVAIKPGTLEIAEIGLVDTDPDPDLNYLRTFDSGTFNVNYVPEPTSMMALLGLAMAGSALSLVRRRARKS